MGHRGCAKSTLARGFAALLHANEGTQPAFVEVPLGVTEDRLLGSLHAETLVHTGKWRPQPGLLEAAHGGVLYIDEINLLPDALADLLLDSAASGVHRQERDGISQTLLSRYILIGTMNPEEGDLRPQLSDRFAHGVLIQDDFSATDRVEIGRRRIAFDDSPAAFQTHWAPATERLLNQLQAARKLLQSVLIPDALRLDLAQRARDVGLEGMRAELAILRTARAAAAFRGVPIVDESDLKEAWDLCLGHRTTSTPRSDQPTRNPPQAQQHQGPSSSTPNSPTQSASTATQTSSTTAQPLTPKDAQPNPILLRPMQKPRILALPQPLFPNRHLTAPLAGAATARLSTVRLQTGPVRWQASVLASLRNGWTPSSPGWQWIRATAAPLRRFWALLDASRSTGAAQFLADARETLAEALRTSKRVNLLLLRENQMTWIARNALSSKAKQRLESLRSAAGKSPLVQAINTLHRAVSASRPTQLDTVCLCSDGLPTLDRGESATEAGRRVRLAVSRLARNLPTAPVWLSPGSHSGRGLSAWLEKTIQGSGALLVKLPGR